MLETHIFGKPFLILLRPAHVNYENHFGNCTHCNGKTGLASQT
ncbi:hypothetical protein LEP1GSC186_2888 [Leptospira noguchii serovar Autumnalis str. ZUN142]|uniref:Uncharacterized protein n=1 Tax=Leptospira noguchii serovar Autumnalis str. ZUN142 TaxID=1085540 RepID=M6U1E2_9LEPT|nr:hypothetical protein LEP1GSC186_2888 [Leptospira noguchii serovar Autumnalis str. ZUN142]